MKNGPDALQIPDVVLHILAHVNAPTLLSLRLVSSSLNSIIVTHQRTICKSIICNFGKDIDLCRPAVRESSKYYHLRLTVRARKAKALASDAIARKDFFDGRRMRQSRDPWYHYLVAHCMRGILVVWNLSDIQEHVGPFYRLPTYVPTPPHSSVSSRPHSRSGRLSRFLADKIRIFSASAAANTPKPENSTRVSKVPDLSIMTLAPRTTIEVENRLGKIRSAQRQYLRTLDRISRVDFELAQQYIMTLMPRCRDVCHCSDSIGPTDDPMVLRRRSFALQQVPRFMLSVLSTDLEEKRWAWVIVNTVSAGRGLLPEMKSHTVTPFDFEDQGESKHERERFGQEARRIRSVALRRINERRF